MYSTGHVGPIMPKRDRLDRHCETTKSNSECLYPALGCLGCTLTGAWIQRDDLIQEVNLKQEGSPTVNPSI